MLNAAAAVGVFPVLLDHPVIAAEGLVEFGSSRIACRRAAVAAVAGRGRAEVEIALVRVLLAGAVEPRVQVRIGDGFFLFVSQDVDQAVSAAHARGRAVRTGGLDLATRRAAVRIADESPLDVRSVQRLARVETA